MPFTILKTELSFRFLSILLSANAFNLEKSKFLLFDKEVTRVTISYDKGEKERNVIMYMCIGMGKCTVYEIAIENRLKRTL